jgi:glyoxylase I family protein
MNRTQAERSAPAHGQRQGTDFILGFHGVRYQVKDVSRSIDFYTTHLGFELEHKQLPAFASV